MAGELQQVHNAKESAAAAHDHLEVRCDSVGPLRRNRANDQLIDPQQQSLAVAVVPHPDA
jgi:hypothetical protein